MTPLVRFAVRMLQEIRLSLTSAALETGADDYPAVAEPKFGKFSDHVRTSNAPELQYLRPNADLLPYQY